MYVLKQKSQIKKANSIEYVGEFNNTTPKAQCMKEIIEKLDFIKTENVCSARDNVNRK